MVRPPGADWKGNFSSQNLKMGNSTFMNFLFLDFEKIKNFNLFLFCANRSHGNRSFGNWSSNLVGFNSSILINLWTNVSFGLFWIKFFSFDYSNSNITINEMNCFAGIFFHDKKSITSKNFESYWNCFYMESWFKVFLFDSLFWLKTNSNFDYK